LDFTSAIATIAGCLSKSMREAFTRAKCFRHFDYNCGDAQLNECLMRQFGN
jgi:hypothetical protein